MYKHNKLFLIYTFLSIFCYFSISQSADYFTDQGSIWVGSGFGFSNIIDDDNDKNRILLLNPYIRFFPVNFLTLGPRIQWLGQFTENVGGNYTTKRNTNQLGFGADVGFAYGKSTPVIPYVNSGFQYDLYIYHTKNNNPNSSLDYRDTYNGFLFPVDIGIIIPIKGIFAVQIESGFRLRWIIEDSPNRSNYRDIGFSISFGFAGVGKKFAVSCLNTFSSLY